MAARGNYNSLGVKLTKRYSSGLTHLVTYTCAKSIDGNQRHPRHDGDTLFPQNSYCMRCERGLSSLRYPPPLRDLGSVRHSVRQGPPVDIENRASRTPSPAAGRSARSSPLQTGFPMTVHRGTRPVQHRRGLRPPELQLASIPTCARQADPQRLVQPGRLHRPDLRHVRQRGPQHADQPVIFGWDFSTLKNFTLFNSPTIA